MSKINTKYIFVTGGVLSSVGKGIFSASLANLLKQANFKVSMLKVDPYINVDPGTMSPFEHGEVFVTEDGTETDLDLGHYERFLDENLSKKNNFTAGRIYSCVIEKERNGFYLGQTIQVIPHIVGEIKDRIKNVGRDNEFLIVEVGGTVGDIESLPFLEAIREMSSDARGRVVFIHLTLLPYIKTIGELKTKPTQHSIQELRRIGIAPNIVICRTSKKIPLSLKKKISHLCGVELNSIIESLDAKSIYQVPINILKENILSSISNHLNIDNITPNAKSIDDWRVLVNRIVKSKKNCNIAFVGKYLSIKDSYTSLIEALKHSSAHLGIKTNIVWIDTKTIQKDKLKKTLRGVDGILIPGGFGKNGTTNMITAISYAREHNVPYLGICLGMQLALVEFARNVLKIDDANSIEFDKKCKNPIVYLIDNFIDREGNKQIRTFKSPTGATMRLGSYKISIKNNTTLKNIYKKKHTFERHRHRYEINNNYKSKFENAGIVVSGTHNNLIEAIELQNHRCFMGVQFHPEFKSRLKTPSGIITHFIKASLEHKEHNNK